jgi:hypothetical protein
LAGIAAADVDLAVTDEVIGPGRIAFAVTATLPGGRRVYEHVILHLRSDRIARQVDVEAWDRVLRPRSASTFTKSVL